jgi:hypothetical protein
MRSAWMMTVLMLLGLPVAEAQRVRGVLRLGGDFGGDELVQFQYSDGTSPSVTAGAGLLATLGAVFPLAQRRGQGLELEASAGVKYRTIPPATNQSANWMRVPLQGLVFYRARAFRVGGGVAVHVANALSASGAALNSKVEFDTSPGFIAQAEYDFGRVGLDVRYTIMKYEISRGGSGSVNANSIGGGVSFFFGGGPGGHRRAR